MAQEPKQPDCGKVLVIKLGTSVLTQGTRALNRAHMLEIVRQCAIARQAGHTVIVVSSGAIAAGREHLLYPDLPPVIASKQLLAAVGQSKLIQVWEQLFSIYDLHIGQMLLTRADLEDPDLFPNSRDMMPQLMDDATPSFVHANYLVTSNQL